MTNLKKEDVGTGEAQLESSEAEYLVIGDGCPAPGPVHGQNSLQYEGV